MNQLRALEALHAFDKKGKYVFTKHDMAKLFPDDKPKTLDEGLKRLVKVGLIKRACRGVYVNEHALCFDSYTIEHVAKALRRNAFSYLSLESMLSEYGLISQVPLDRLTLMTTGRKGIHKTLYGVIEFTHTQRSSSNILDHAQLIPGCPLRRASPDTALRDLKRVGRNLHLLNLEANEDV